VGGGGKARRRRLNPEEQRLWSRVTASTNALHPHKIGDLANAAPEQGETESQVSKATPFATTPIGAGSQPPETLRPKQALLRVGSPSLPDPGSRPANGYRHQPQALRTSLTRIAHAAPDAGPVGWREPGLDRRTSARLRKGAREPDARIDLHGMTAERAHMACLRFVGAGLARGDRVLLVVTGKGRRDEYGHLTARGILRQSLPGWLHASPLGASIVGIYQAHAKHGGAGAFYVYLRRSRPRTR